MKVSASTLVALAVTASASPLLGRQSNSSAQVSPATYDGSCFYPKGDETFPGLDQYVGRWYQVAGTTAGFTAGCTCVYALYVLNSDNTVSVNNYCQTGNISTTIQGTASPVDAAYGPAALQVRFASVPGGGVTCPGPNYVVQKYDASGWAIVQAPSFRTLFVLSRVQRPADAAIDEWLSVAGKLGANLTAVTKTTQTNCHFTD